MTRDRLHLVLALLVLSTTACRPKGSNKTPTMEKTSVGNYVIRHPNFEGHLDPKVAREGSKWTLTLDYTGMPEKSAITLEGKTVALARSGRVPTSLDLAAAIGDAPIEALTISARVPVNIPFELTFFDKRQKVSSTLTEANVWSALRSCMTSPPCPFPSDGAPHAKPNIVFFKSGDSMGQQLFGAPSQVRDVDWIATSSAPGEVDGKMCKMQRMGPAAVKLTDEYVLKRETERLVVYDRRSGAKLHEKELVAEDRCPIIADIKLTGEKSGLRSELTAADRDRWFRELRGDVARPPASATPVPSSHKPKKPRK